VAKVVILAGWSSKQFVSCALVSIQSSPAIQTIKPGHVGPGCLDLIQTHGLGNGENPTNGVGKMVLHHMLDRESRLSRVYARAEVGITLSKGGRRFMRLPPI
jgi:hypothetical protein